MIELCTHHRLIRYVGYEGGYAKRGPTGKKFLGLGLTFLYEQRPLWSQLFKVFFSLALDDRPIQNGRAGRLKTNWDSRDVSTETMALLYTSVYRSLISRLGIYNVPISSLLIIDWARFEACEWTRTTCELILLPYLYDDPIFILVEVADGVITMDLIYWCLIYSGGIVQVDIVDVRDAVVDQVSVSIGRPAHVAYIIAPSLGVTVTQAYIYALALTAWKSGVTTVTLTTWRRLI
jgi:hypothetical protein